MQKVLNNISSGRLKAYIIWMPMRPYDDRASAETRSKEFTDRRVTYFWDGDRLAGKLWQRVLDKPSTVWDVYFLYGADAKWGKEPAVPNFWMSNPAGTSKAAPPLNEPEFELKAKELLSKARSRAPKMKKSASVY